MTPPHSAPLKPWLAALIGVIIQVVLSAIFDQLGVRGDPHVLGGVQALVLLISTAAGAIAAARLSDRATPPWVVGAVGLLAAIAYLYIEMRSGTPAPLWVVASTLGAPLLGARIGEGARA